jgi:hypothetical protein
MKDISIFLGANTGRGFRSLYEEYIAGLDLQRQYVLKGSAGCGKSSLMKRMAAHADGLGITTIRVLCSGDPDSLDGLILPELRTALFDGTSPHVLEPPLVGQAGFYVDLSRFYRAPATGLEAWNASYREHYRKAYRYLAAAAQLEGVVRCGEETRRAIRRRAEALASATLGRGHGSGVVGKYYTDAFTCRGCVTLEESRRAIAPRLVALRGSPDRADLFLQTYLQAAGQRGRAVVICPDPRDDRRIAHLLLPELGFGITAGEGDRRIHLEKLGPPLTAGEKEEQRKLEKTRAALLDAAQAELALAKADHDRLEEAARPFIDFGGVTALTEELTGKIFGGV